MIALPNPFSDFNSLTTGGREETAAAFNSPAGPGAAVANNSNSVNVKPSFADEPAIAADAPRLTNAMAGVNSNSTLASAMTVESATAPDLTDPPVAVADLIPGSAQPLLPIPTGPTTAAGDTGGNATSSPADFSLDVRIHRAMLAVADELADEQRTINEAILLRQFTSESPLFLRHPRDLDLDPPPLFLRKPSHAFLRALYHQLAGVQS
jgi:hypothetical protein